MIEFIIINYLLLAIVLFIHLHTYYYTGDKLALYVWELLIIFILFSIPILSWILFVFWGVLYLWNVLDGDIRFIYRAKWMDSKIVKKLIKILKKNLNN